VKLNADFKKGFWIGLGVGVALVVLGVATGTLEKVL
jgi:hypothetical protein